MRRILVFLGCLFLIACLALTASAETAATQITYQASVSSDESCQMTVAATIHLDEPVKKLTFPVPSSASAITLNGSRVGSSVTEDARLVDLSGITGNMAGDFTVSISYHLPDVIQADSNGILQLQLPLLSGFSFPVEKLGFTVTMPGTITGKPAFSSGYHQANIEQDLIFSYSENTVTGTSSRALKDHETLVMSLVVSEELFPQAVIQLQELDGFYIGMGISAALALLYWLLCLRAVPPKFLTVPTPPAGYGAGQLGTLISLQGTDLTAMVFSWAQSGYLILQPDKRGRVLLHKHMEMGNERSQFEQRCFQTLFGSRLTVDTAGMHYTLLCRQIGRQRPSLQGILSPRSGSLPLFRFLMALVGMFDGICLGLTLSQEAAVQWFPAVLLAVGCGIAAWHIQFWADSLFTRHKGKLLLALLLCLAWLGLSLAAQTTALDAWIIAALLLTGLMATFGGRRTESGRQLMSETLGFRHYLKTIPRDQIKHICRRHPEYYHALTPYALALGCGSAFAKRFSRDLIPPCPYITGMALKPMTALQWHKRLRSIVRSMESRLRQQPVERLRRLLAQFTR